MATRRFGEFLKECRIKRGETLRAFCKLNGFDAANMSRLERGQVPPPVSRDKLEHYAKALGLQEGTDDWFEFFDLAAAETGRIPDDILDDRELLPKLPLVFRTLRGERVPQDQLDELIDLIRKA